MNNDLVDKVMMASYEDICYIFNVKVFDPSAKDRHTERLKPIQFTQVALLEVSDFGKEAISRFFGRSRALLYNSIKSVNNYCFGSSTDTMRLVQCRTIVQKYLDLYLKKNPYYAEISDLIRDLEYQMLNDKLIKPEFEVVLIEKIKKYNDFINDQACRLSQKM